MTVHSGDSVTISLCGLKGWGIWKPRVTDHSLDSESQITSLYQRDYLFHYIMLIPVVKRL